MTNEEATKILLVMTQLWWKWKIPDGTLQLWKNEFRGCDYDVAEEALNALGGTSEDWPSFAQFRAQYRNQKRRPNWHPTALSTPPASKEAAMQHIKEMRANLHN